MKGRAKAAPLPLQPAEFDALPHSVQRKYFSSLERLQIQQQSFEEPTSGRSSRASSATPFRPSLTLPSRKHRARKFEQAVPGHDLFHAQVDFFLSLPDKLKKQHFSPEERVLFLHKSEQAFLPDEHDSERAQQRFDDFHFDFFKPPDGASGHGQPHRPSSAASSPTSPTHVSFCLPVAKEEEDPSASSLPYFDIMSPPAPCRAPAVSNLRRTMSLTASSARFPASTAVLMAGAPMFTIAPSPRHQRAHSSSLSGRRSSHTPTAPVFDPEATHYQDPEARKKLRMYLASPQKFDEAIEFGFPSTAGNDTVTPHYQLPPIDNHARKFSRDMHTFLKDGKLSFLEDTSSENQGLAYDCDSVTEEESPTTPSSTGLSFRLHSRQFSYPKFSMDSARLSPAQSGTGQLNREMTLRMTLTRPDLRADEDQLYAWQASSPKAAKDDPLALEDLVLTDDMTGTKGAFYIKPKIRGNLVTRLLKRASLKAR